MRTTTALARILRALADKLDPPARIRLTIGGTAITARAIEREIRRTGQIHGWATYAPTGNYRVIT